MQDRKPATLSDYMHHLTHRPVHTMNIRAPDVKHWLEVETAQCFK